MAHAGLLLVAIVLSLLGAIAAFDFHSANNIPHLYSLHSWTGMLTVTLFILQVQHIYELNNATPSNPNVHDVLFLCFHIL